MAAIRKSESLFNTGIVRRCGLVSSVTVANVAIPITAVRIYRFPVNAKMVTPNIAVLDMDKPVSKAGSNPGIPHIAANPNTDALRLSA